MTKFNGEHTRLEQPINYLRELQITSAEKVIKGEGEAKIFLINDLVFIDSR